MTQRLNGFTVALNDSMREDDAEAIRLAISLLKGVAAVKPIEADVMLQAVKMQAKTEMLTKIYEALH